MYAYLARRAAQSHPLFITLRDLREGSLVLVRGQRVTVTEVDRDIKNGEAGICFDGGWAYLSEVQEVVRY